MAFLAGIANVDDASPIPLSLVKTMTSACQPGLDRAHGLQLARNAALICGLSDQGTGSGIRQPVFNEDEQICAMLSGHLHQAHAERTGLISLGHRFYSNLDAEIAVHLYEQWGEAFVSHLHGDFVLALWDAGKQRLILHQSPLSSRGLFISTDQKRIYFASDSRYILALPGFRGELDPVVLLHYLHSGYTPRGASIFREVWPMASGATILAERGRIDVDGRRNCTVGVPGMAIPELRDQLADRCRESVDDAVGGASSVVVRADQGAGTNLLLRMLSRTKGLEVHSIAVGTLEGPGPRLLTENRELASRFGTEHHEVLLGPDEAVRLLPLVINRLTAPHFVANALVAEAVAGGALPLAYLVIDGFGALDLPGLLTIRHGVGSRLNGALRKVLRHHPSGMKLPTGESDDAMNPGPVGWNVPVSELRPLLNSAASMEIEAYFLNQRFRRGVEYAAEDDLDARMHPILEAFPRPLVSICGESGLKARLPFWEPGCLALADQLGRADAPMMAAQGHDILRRGRPATGTPGNLMGLCIHDWVSGPWQSWMVDSIRSDRMLSRGFLDPDAVRGWIVTPGEHSVIRAVMMLRLVTLDLWLRLHVDGEDLVGLDVRRPRRRLMAKTSGEDRSAREAAVDRAPVTDGAWQGG